MDNGTDDLLGIASHDKGEGGEGSGKSDGKVVPLVGRIAGAIAGLVGMVKLLLADTPTALDFKYTSAAEMASKLAKVEYDRFCGLGFLLLAIFAVLVSNRR